MGPEHGCTDNELGHAEAGRLADWREMWSVPLGEWQKRTDVWGREGGICPCQSTLFCLLSAGIVLKGFMFQTMWFSWVFEFWTLRYIICYFIIHDTDLSHVNMILDFWRLITLPQRWSDELLQIVCGQNCTFVVQNNGTVLACGEGSYGRLGQGNSDDLHSLTAISSIQGIFW